MEVQVRELPSGYLPLVGTLVSSSPHSLPQQRVLAVYVGGLGPGYTSSVEPPAAVLTSPPTSLLASSLGPGSGRRAQLGKHEIYPLHSLLGFTFLRGASRKVSKTSSLISSWAEQWLSYTVGLAQAPKFDELQAGM